MNLRTNINSVSNFLKTMGPRIARSFSSWYRTQKTGRYWYAEFGIKIMAFILLGFFVFSLIVNFSSTFQLELGCSNKAIKYFFEEISSSIQIGAAVIALFTILLTIERMRQSDRQTHLLSDNNRFNNYYKHRDKFFEFCNLNDYFREKLRNSDMSGALNFLYLSYYSTTFKDFTGKYNDVFLSRANYFMNMITLLTYLDFTKENLYVDRIMDLSKYYTLPARDFVKSKNKSNNWTPFNLDEEELVRHEKKVKIVETFDTLIESVEILNELNKFEYIKLSISFKESKSRLREIESRLLERIDKIKLKDLED